MNSDSDEVFDDDDDTDSDLDLDSDEGSEVDPDLDPDDELEQELESEVEVACPFCGEPVVITVDAGGGAVQEYVEDCQVCCNPWLVNVRYARDGTLDVWVEES